MFFYLIASNSPSEEQSLLSQQSSPALSKRERLRPPSLFPLGFVLKNEEPKQHVIPVKNEFCLLKKENIYVIILLGLGLGFFGRMIY